MSRTFDEIDTVIIRTNKIYLSYAALSLGLSGIILRSTKYSKKVKFLLGLSSSFFTSGICTWIHIYRVYTPFEITYLKVGLDKEYEKIKSSKNT